MQYSVTDKLIWSVIVCVGYLFLSAGLGFVLYVVFQLVFSATQGEDAATFLSTSYHVPVTSLKIFIIMMGISLLWFLVRYLNGRFKKSHS